MISKEYLAGLIDGEGHLGVAFASPKSNKTRTTIEIELGKNRVIHFKLLKEIQKQYGGNYSLHRNQPRVRFSSKQADDLINQILPYLIIKKDNALITQEIKKLRTDTKKNKEKINELINKSRNNNQSPKPKTVRLIE